MLQLRLPLLPLLALLPLVLSLVLVSDFAAFAASVSSSSTSESSSSDVSAQMHANAHTRAHAVTTSVWGTYRPDLYYGIRARLPTSPLFGMLWTDLTNRSFEIIRHDAEERDHVTRYGWLIHNGDSYGRQEIIDEDLHLNMTIYYLNPTDDNGRIMKDRWISRITIEPIPSNSETTSAQFLWYLGQSHPGDRMTVRNPNPDGLEGDIIIDINNTEMGDLIVHAFPSSSGHPRIPYYTSNGVRNVYNSPTTRFYGANVRSSWDAKEHTKNIFLKELRGQYGARTRLTQVDANTVLLPLLPNHIATDSNFLLFQHIVTLPFTLDFVLAPASVTEHSSTKDEVLTSAATTSDIVDLFDEEETLFNLRFNMTFPSSSIPLAIKNDDHVDRFAKHALSNMLGGIGYFHGPTIEETYQVYEVPNKEGVKIKKKKPIAQESVPVTLFSTVPSRSFFPRGFLWDEGFHQLLVNRWDATLSQSILSSWLSLIKRNGWLPREQIPGDAARKRVPTEFQTQRPTIANPPTLVLAIGRMLTRQMEVLQSVSNHLSAEVDIDGTSPPDRLSDHPQLFDEFRKLAQFVAAALPPLERHVDWFYRTQSATPLSSSTSDDSKRPSQSLSTPTTFRWGGRTLGHCLASGLDDYPRAEWLPKKTDRRDTSVMDDGLEGHVDLHCWMIALNQCMSTLTRFLSEHISFLGETQLTAEDLFEKSQRYHMKAIQLLGRLDELHWNQDEQQYCDYAYRNGTRQFVCHTGYATLLPLFLGFIKPDNPHFISLLDLVENPDLMTKGGLRSLIKSDPLYGTSEDYWRGHIWLNFNYLAVQALAQYSDLTRPSETGSLNPSKDYRSLLSHITPLELDRNSSPLHGRIRRIYTNLRSRVVQNVYNEYKHRGFLYEQYHAETGQGRKCHPFTGWTSLVLNMLAETY